MAKSLMLAPFMKPKVASNISLVKNDLILFLPNILNF